MARLAVIADDLTGANDTAVQFAKRGISTCVQIDFDRKQLAEQDTDVIVLNTDSRDMEKKEAYETVKKAASSLKTQKIEHIYKKVDSTLRGNFGVEIAAVDDVFHPAIIVIAPAFPKNHRITIGGYHFLDGLPIEMTEIANAPKTPVHDSSIARLIEIQTGKSTGLISLVILKQGLQKVREEISRLLAKGERWIVFDIVQEEHFNLLLQAVEEYQDVLWVGSAGLANYLPEIYEWSPHRCIREDPATSGPVLVVAGSVSHTTQAQATELMQQPRVVLVKIDMEAFFDNAPEELERCRRDITKGFAAKCDVLFVSSMEDADVEKAMQAGKRHSLSGSEVSEGAACFMADVISALDMRSLAGMVLTGGDIAVHVLRNLAAENIEILSEVAAGIPLGKLCGGCCDGMKVVTKAGAFGAKDCFVQALRVIRRVNQRRCNRMKKPVLGITMGDAAGIGAEIIVKALEDAHIYEISRPVVFGDKKILERAAKLVDSKLTIRAVAQPAAGGSDFGIIDVVDLDNLPVDLPFGRLDARAGKAAYEYIKAAVEYAMKQEVHAIVTAPLNKEALHMGGCPYPGHTEILGALTGQKDYSMMLVSGPLKVIHVTTHVSMREACDLIKKERVETVIRLADDTLKLMGIGKPRIAVAGFNCHSGEHGLFGGEDDAEILPAVEAAKALGIDADGPIPPDTVFHRAANLKEFDIVVCMYHDQGHIPIKVLGFATGVNVTVGLPCIRTSVDHGTAFAVAGKGTADSRSMTEALLLGAQMAKVKFIKELA